MALIQVTEESLRQQVSPLVFGEAQMLADQGLVTALSARGASLIATVDDHPATVTITAAGISAACACDAAEPCRHALAATLAWVRTGPEHPTPDLYALLRLRDPDWLARQLATLAEADPTLADRLLAEIEQSGGTDELADLRADLEEVMAELLAEADGHDHDDWYGEGWYPDSGDLEEILDEIDELIADLPDATLEVIVRAIDLIEAAMDTEKVYGGELLDTLHRVESMHLDACLTGSPDPVRLAEWLIGKALTSGWCSFERSLADYAPVLGEPGLRRCHDLLAGNVGAKLPDYKMSALREALARAEGGTEAVVAVLAENATGLDIVKIAQLPRTPTGRTE